MKSQQIKQGNDQDVWPWWILRHQFQFLKRILFEVSLRAFVWPEWDFGTRETKLKWLLAIQIAKLTLT